MSANFDPLAKWYHLLELSSFGVALEAARFAHIQQLAGCQHILLLGDGDGRFLKRLLKISPDCRVRSIDASAEMLRMAEKALNPADCARVTFDCADALTVDLPTFAYDGVATIFFLDCFTNDESAPLVGRIANTLRPGGTWVFADFAVPERGVGHVIGRALTSALYAFFRLTTGISARHLPDSERFIMNAGLAPIDTKASLFGVLRSVAFLR